MSDVFAYYEKFLHEEPTLLWSGLVLVFAFQGVVFRWAERSSLLTATYFGSR